MVAILSIFGMKKEYAITDTLGGNSLEILNSIDKKLCSGTRVDSGEFAYSARQMRLITDMVLAKKWLILGGDVYNCYGKFSYISWYFEPLPYLSLEENVDASIETCCNFLEKIEMQMPNSLFVPVISDKYIAGK
jgi:hypothetical protein